MSIKKFDTLFGLKSSIDEEKEKFANRIEIGIFNWIKQNYQQNEYYILFKATCYELGINGDDKIKYYKENPFYRAERNSYSYPSFNILNEENDFTGILRVIVALYNSSSSVHSPLLLNRISSIVIDSLEKATSNIGVKWVDGIFYPIGDELLDIELIDNSFKLLSPYPNERKDLQNALSNHQSKNQYGVIDNCYKAIEGISRAILKNGRTLDNNKLDLLNFLPNTTYWGTILANYIKYAHEYARHAGADRHNLKPEEVEGFLYLTCLMVRLIISSANSKTPK